MSKPKLFIGSSVEGLEIAYALQENLKYAAETTVWDQGVFNLSESSLESLLTVLESSDFGVFVFSPDDHIKIRGKRDLAVRDNVLFELGLFVGKLGRKRSFIVIPENKEFHLPTDLIGMAPAKYEANRSDKNMQAGTGSAAHKIREAINKQGPLNIVEEEVTEDASQSVERKEKNESWVDYLFTEKNYDKAIQELKKKARYAKDIDEKVHFKGWICYAIFQKDPIEGVKEYDKLIAEYSTNSVAYSAYANNYIWTNSYNKALEIIELGLINCVRKINLTNLQAKCLWATAKKEEAIELLNNSILLTPDVNLYTSLADYYHELADHKSVYDLLKKAYFIYPNNAELIYKFAKSARDHKEIEVSILLFKELISINPNNSDYWGYLGNSYYDLKLFNLALTAYEKAADLSNHKEGWIYGNIGNVYSTQELYDKAEMHFKKALNLDDKSQYAHNRISTLYKSKQEETKRLTEVIAQAKAKLNSDAVA